MVMIYTLVRCVCNVWSFFLYTLFLVLFLSLSRKFGLPHQDKAQVVAVSHGTSHVTIKQHFRYTTSVDILKTLCKLSYSHSFSCISLEFSGSAQKQRIALYSFDCEVLRADLETRRSTRIYIQII